MAWLAQPIKLVKNLPQMQKEELVARKNVNLYQIKFKQKPIVTKR